MPVGHSTKYYSISDKLLPLGEVVNGHTVEADVPADAVFTDTTYTPSAEAPIMDGTGAVGTSTKYARADHVHPSDPSRVPTTRTVNNKALSSDITLTASDVGAMSSSAAVVTDIKVDSTSIVVDGVAKLYAGTGISITNGTISLDLANANNINY